MRMTSCPMAPLALLVGGVVLLASVLPLIPTWAYALGGVAALALWVVFVDADLLTLLCGLRGVHKPALYGQVVWVLGASSGIGEELAVQMSAAGAKVILSARRKDELDRVARRCRERDGGFSPLVLPLDILAGEEAHRRAVEEIKAKFGGRLDIAVLNVGRTQRALAEDTEVPVVRAMFDLNVLACISLAQACLPTFLAQRSGTFLVTSSVSGKMAAPASSAYVASKHAIQGYFDTLRTEVSDRGIRVCVACPGPVATPIEAAAFTEQMGKVRAPTEKLESKMPVERCATLMLAAMTRGVDEAWIAHNPVLLFVYLSQYCPQLAREIAKRWMGPLRTRAFRQGVDFYSVKAVASLAANVAASKEQ